MANVAVAYGAEASLTISGLATLANATLSSASTTISPSGNVLDYLISVNCTVGTIVAPASYSVYAFSSLDNVTFSDSSGTPPQNGRLLGTVSTPTSTTAYPSPAFSVAAAFSGTLPPNFQIRVYNNSGAAFTAGTAEQMPVYATVI